MDDKTELIEALVARMKAADDALHSGDAGPRKALWSAKEPVTVFGAAMSATGPAQARPPSTGWPPGTRASNRPGGRFSRPT